MGTFEGLTSDLLRLYDDVTSFTHYVLMSKTGQRARNYLKARGITESTMKKFKLGYAPGGSRIYKYLSARREYSDELIHESKICDVTKNRSKDFFRQYIMFPVMYRGRTVSFTARWPSENPPPRAIKHKHLKGSLRFFYNMDGLRRKNIFIVEGPVDALTLLQEGFNAVGTLGVGGITNRNADYFNENENIFIAFDTDPNDSGILGALRSSIILFEYANQDPYIVELPAEEDKKVDINSYFRKHSEDDFYELISSAKSFSHRQDGKKLIRELNEKKREQVRRNYSSVLKEDEDFDALYYQVRDYPIERIVADYTSLSSAGAGRLKGVCPFSWHKDTTPSFYLFVEDNMFKCYGCHKNSFGDTIQFIQNTESLDFKEAVLFIRDNYIKKGIDEDDKA